MQVNNSECQSYTDDLQGQSRALPAASLQQLISRTAACSRHYLYHAELTGLTTHELHTVRVIPVRQPQSSGQPRILTSHQPTLPEVPGILQLQGMQHFAAVAFINLQHEHMDGGHRVRLLLSSLGKR